MAGPEVAGAGVGPSGVGYSTFTAGPDRARTHYPFLTTVLREELSVGL
jgi:hypothetical protein